MMPFRAIPPEILLGNLKNVRNELCLWPSKAVYFLSDIVPNQSTYTPKTIMRVPNQWK